MITKSVIKAILITGCNRSGTTLLATCLSLNKEVVVIEGDYYGSGIINVIGKKPILKQTIPIVLWKTKRSVLMVWIMKKFIKFFKLRGLTTFNIQDFDKVIFIRRNYEANIKSIKKRTGCSNRIAKKYVGISRLIENKLKVSKKEFYIVSLRKLTTETEKTLRNICKFVSIEYDKRMLDGFKYTRVYSNSKIEPKI